MHLRWQVFHKKGKGVLNSRILNHMVVIEHQGKVRQLHARQIVDEQSKQGFHCYWRRGLQQRQARAPDLLLKRLKGGDHVGEKANEVVVLSFKGVPRHRRCAPGEIVREQGGLAKSRSGGTKRKAT